MSHPSFRFCKTLSEELDPERLLRRFLASLLELQNVERGSIWVKRDGEYVCVEAMGRESERVKGISIGADRSSIVGWVIENKQMTIAKPGKDARHLGAIEEGMDVKSRLILCFPLFLKSGDVYGAVQIIDTEAGGSRLNLKQDHLDMIQGIIDVASVALSNSLVFATQKKENEQLKNTLQSLRGEEPMLGRSQAFLTAMKAAQDYAATDFPVLITGESGTGKEVFAREIHRLSKRRDKPFSVQNCSAIPESLLESELFGYTKGAFTGATRDKAGLFEAAQGGTVFLDEIGDMPLHLQARILRVLQNSEIKPLGSNTTRKVDVRILSATNKDLREAIADGGFREDLYYRLNVLPLHLPPLRERQTDIELLLEHFLKRECLRLGIPTRRLSREALRHLLTYPWPGNIRELENFVKHIIVVVADLEIEAEDLPAHFRGEAVTREEERRAREAVPPKPDAPGSGGSPFDGLTWDELEKSYVLYLLEKNRWHVTRAAKEAGLNRSTFDSRMRRLGIRRT